MFDKHLLDMNIGDTALLETSFSVEGYENKLKPEWSTSDAKVVTVKDGVLKSVGEGTAVVTVKLANGNTDECQIRVVDLEKQKQEQEHERQVKAIKVELNNHSIILGKNTTAILTADITPKEYAGEVTLTWFSSKYMYYIVSFS